MVSCVLDFGELKGDRQFQHSACGMAKSRPGMVVGKFRTEKVLRLMCFV
jgi:hypothetical protein